MKHPVPFPIQEITFKCLDCRFTFKAAPSRVEDEPARAHPYRYFANCPECSKEVQQVNWEVGVFCSVLASTGPKTPEGKAKAAANLLENNSINRNLSRFNALKHGANAKTAMYFPARPGKYPQCATCDVDFDYCATQPACIKRTELTMQHLMAYQNGDPSSLMQIQAVNQANMQAIFSDMVQTLAADGVALRNPVHAFDKEGGFHLARYTDSETGESITLEETKAHPLSKPMMEMLSRNHMSMADMNMTPKVQTDQNIQMGQLASDGAEKESLQAYQQQNQDSLNALREQINRSQQRINQDPILAEYQQNNPNDAAEGEFIELNPNVSPNRR